MHVDDGFSTPRLREPVEHMVYERACRPLSPAAFGIVSVSGRIRVREPGGQHHGAARRDFSGGAHLDLQCWHIGAVPGGEGCQIWVSQRSLEIVPDARHVSQILAAGSRRSSRANMPRILRRAARRASRSCARSSTPQRVLCACAHARSATARRSPSFPVRRHARPAAAMQDRTRPVPSLHPESRATRRAQRLRVPATTAG